jgi:hypothetical protein
VTRRRSALSIVRRLYGSTSEPDADGYLREETDGRVKPDERSPEALFLPRAGLNNTKQDPAHTGPSSRLSKLALYNRSFHISVISDIRGCS